MKEGEKMSQQLEQLFQEPKQNLLYGKPIPDKWKSWYKEVYDELNGNVPKCGFTEIMNRELNLTYGPNV